VGLDIDEASVVWYESKGFEAYAVDCTKSDSVAALGIGTFDRVILGELIEHVDNPVELLRTAALLCSDDGLLVITTPNAYSLGGVVNAARSRECIHPDHVVVFTPRTLVACAQRAGLRPVALTTYSADSLVLRRAERRRRPTNIRDAAVRWLGFATSVAAQPFPYLQPGLILVCRPGNGSEE
jgi:SAM-dependent methyltransferase